MKLKKKGDEPDVGPDVGPNVGSKARKEALGHSQAGFFTKGSAAEPAKPLAKPNKGNKQYIEKGKKGPTTPPMKLNARIGKGRKRKKRGPRSSDPNNRANQLRGKFVNTSRGPTTDEEQAHNAAVEASKKRRKELLAKFYAMRPEPSK